MTQIASILPGAERFDGTGGAIATWVRETYSRSAFTSIVASPRSSAQYADPVRIARVPLYDVYERGLRTTSMALAAQVKKPFHVVYNRLLWDRLWIRSALRQVGDAQVVHLHNRPNYAKPLREAGYRGAVILHMHNDLRSYLSPEQEDDVLPYLDSVAFCSEFVMSRALEVHPDLPSPSVIPNGVACEEIDRAVRDQETAVQRLLYAGRIIPEKGPLEAINICAELRRRGVDARLDLVGGTGTGSDNSWTPYLAEVTDRAHSVNRAAGFEAVRVLGPRPHAELFDHFASSDMLVLPCRWEEPFGMVALESLAKGCVPFVARRGGLPDVVRDGGHVVDVPENEPDSIVQRFADAIMAYSAPAELATLRERGWARAEELTWESVAAIADAKFTATLSGRSPRNR